MVSSLSEERIDELSEMFERVNKEGPGLEPNEIEALVKEVGLKCPDNFIEKLMTIVDEIDPENEGYIDFHHFCEFVVRLEVQKDKENEIQEAFNAFDRNGD
jgi:Ca2+-binding EF-hand superfamily protein